MKWCCQNHCPGRIVDADRKGSLRDVEKDNRRMQPGSSVNADRVDHQGG